MAFNIPRRALARAAACVLALAGPALAEDAAPLPWTIPLNTFGMPGLIDMPTAQVLPDAELGATITGYEHHTLTTLTFQLAPRVTGSFRYSKIARYDNFNRDARFDRSFDLHMLLLRETLTAPAVALGFRDFAGSGIFEGEYLVATKSLGPRVKVTGGIGWGRLGSRSSFDNPLGIFSSYFDKPRNLRQGTGKVNAGNWFKGEAAFFGGIEYRPTDRLSLRAEWSSDAYDPEVARGVMPPVEHPVNLGVSYRLGQSTDLSMFWIHGRELGVMAQFMLNPKRPPNGNSTEPALPPFARRPAMTADPQAWSTSWAADPASGPALRDALKTRLAALGIRLESLKITDNRVRLRMENLAYDAAPQAVGRTARVLAGALPASIEMFEIVLVEQGLPVTQITLRRSDLEALQYAPDAAWRSFARAQRSDPGGALAPGETLLPGLYPKFSWGLGPYLTGRYFDPHNPLRLEAGAELSAGLDIAPGLTVAGALRKSVIGNIDESRRPSNSVLPHVRTDVNLYDKFSDPAIEYLTAEYLFRPGASLYGRVTAGYLESMYGGLSAEMLWKPQTSRLGLGVEMNVVKKRDFDQLWGFQDYETWTGHVSAYYEVTPGLHAQVDVGRYLAKDWGATLRLDREFANGWRVGAFATMTDVSFADFGEGSFDKGIVFTMPLSWFAGQPQDKDLGMTIRPVTRDGGAKLNVRNRLYDAVRSYHDPDLQKTWGRFWR